MVMPMDLIRALRALLDPLVESTSFALSGVDALDADTGARFGFLEYRGVLDDGRIVLLGIYLLSAQQTIIAQMWAPDDVLRMVPEVGTEAVAIHHQVWLYSPIIDAQVLARTIVAEVRTWLQAFGPPSEPDTEVPHPDA
jgi:hypothetical protein